MKRVLALLLTLILSVSSLLMWHTRHRLRAGSYINIMIVKLT